MGAPAGWKRLAFLDEVRAFCQQGEQACPPRRLLNVVSLGDSLHERDALFRATQDVTDCWGKSVKFVERPRLDLFAKEHRLLSACLKPIVKHKGKLDLCLRFGDITAARPSSAPHGRAVMG